jgi:hypothetical protein
MTQYNRCYEDMSPRQAHKQVLQKEVGTQLPTLAVHVSAAIYAGSMFHTRSCSLTKPQCSLRADYTYQEQCNLPSNRLLQGHTMS